MPPKQAVVDRFMESFKEILPTTVWLKEVSANSSTYDAWSVVSFNHVKDLSSTYMHEYVHLIVENTQKQLRSCMFAERDMNGDSVCVGKHNRFPSSANDLPLPLRTLTFAKDSRPKVIDVVKILQETSSLGGKYKFYTKNCWWYAGVLYKALRTKYNIEQEKNWNTSMIRSWLIATLRKKNYTVSVSVSQIG